MNTLKSILIGALIWAVGASAYTASYFNTILENPEMQANIILAITLIPVAWFGASLYFKKESNKYGIQVAISMVITAVLLDALITVPFLVMPYGGTYYSFFTSPAFWLIAVEYLMIIAIYPSFKSNRSK
ncbi:MAG: DUF5367 family protein [Reichenbachiella sp.]|uniref:DUF5367 family protein n=1 Tax=Reichenbachiella sp. TaxID=2184521 RepID=UPI003296A42E